MERKKNELQSSKSRSFARTESVLNFISLASIFRSSRLNSVSMAAAAAAALSLEYKATLGEAFKYI